MEAVQGVRMPSRLDNHHLTIDETTAMANMLADLGLVTEVYKFHGNFGNELQHRVLECCFAKGYKDDAERLLFYDDDSYRLLLDSVGHMFSDPLADDIALFRIPSHRIGAAIKKCKHRIREIGTPWEVYADLHNRRGVEIDAQMEERVKRDLTSCRDEYYRIVGNLYLYEGQARKALDAFSHIQDPNDYVAVIVNYLSAECRNIARQRWRPTCAWREWVGSYENPGFVREMHQELVSNFGKEAVYGTIGGLTFGAAAGYLAKVLVDMLSK